MLVLEEFVAFKCLTFFSSKKLIQGCLFVELENLTFWCEIPAYVKAYFPVLQDVPRCQWQSKSLLQNQLMLWKSASLSVQCWQFFPVHLFLRKVGLFFFSGWLVLSVLASFRGAPVDKSDAERHLRGGFVAVPCPQAWAVQLTLLAVFFTERRGCGLPGELLGLKHTVWDFSC